MKPTLNNVIILATFSNQFEARHNLIIEEQKNIEANLINKVIKDLFNYEVVIEDMVSRITKKKN